MTKTTNYDALRIQDVYGGDYTFVTRGYYPIPENHKQLLDIIRTLPLATNEVRFASDLKDTTIEELFKEPVMDLLEKEPYICRPRYVKGGVINWFALKLVNLKEEKERIQHEADKKLAKFKTYNTEYSLIFQLDACFYNGIKDYGIIEEQWFGDDNSKVVNEAYGSAIYGYSEELNLDSTGNIHELENPNPYLSTEQLIEKYIVDTMMTNKSHYLNFYENRRKSNASWDDSIGYQFAFHTEKSYQETIQKELEDQLNKMAHLTKVSESEKNLISDNFLSETYIKYYLLPNPNRKNPYENKQLVFKGDWTKFNTIRELLEHIGELDYYLEKRVRFFKNKLNQTIQVGNQNDNEAIDYGFEIKIDMYELNQKVEPWLELISLTEFNKYLNTHRIINY